MISGMTLHPGVEYTREIMRQEYLTLASLDCRPEMNKGETNLTAHLVLKCDGYEHVLCTLQQGIVHQQILNFVLHERENLTLTVEGTGIIHVTGYSMEHPVLSHQMTGRTETALKREVHDGIQDLGRHSAHPSPEGNQSTIIGEDCGSEIKCESQHRCDLESAETEKGSYQWLNDENNVLTDSVTVSAVHSNDTGIERVTVGAIYNNDTGTHRVTEGAIYNNGTGSEPVEISDINMDTNDNRGSNFEDALSTDKIVEVTCNCLPNLKVELEQETDQNLNSKNALQTDEENVDVIASYENISTDFTESSTIYTDRKDLRLSIGENTLSSNDVIEGTGNCTLDVNADTEQGSDQLMDSSNALLTSRTENIFGSNESTYAAMELPTLEMDRNDHCQSPDDKDEGTCMDQTFSEEAILEARNGNIVEVSYMKKEETQASCELFDGNVGNVIYLEAIESKNVHLDSSPHQACLKTKSCTVLLKKIDQSYGKHPYGHSSRKSFKCQFCDKVFKEKVILAMHERNHTVKQAVTSQSSVGVLNGRQFKCQFCTKEFNTVDHLRRHRSIHFGKKNFKCDKCGKKFQHMVHLKAHERIHTGKNTYKHNHCLKKSIHRTVLKLHENNYTDSSLFTCEYYNKEFCQKAGLQQHQGYHSSNKSFTCLDCGKTYISKRNLKRHERIHTGERPFSCKHCDKKFGRKTVLKRHERTHTGERPFSCKHCDKKFGRKTVLKRHERTHTGERPFSCKHCDKKFGRKTVLKRHERTHTGERPFSCKHCDKKFSRKSNLLHHEQMHTGEKPFSCKYCDKNFIQKSGLNQHEKTHTGERPFSCKLCYKKFSRNTTLKQHEKTHTGERPFTCRQCDKKFSHKTTLQKHERIHTY
ncbi:hypothetical protein HOLleu_43227 [Holothuria leucospilota]|uniref:C2H2-type domain-containing protein n=1 Tax=Holothuria leucospilota TaxID=206669 RepID=A0A9Q0YAW9_HOLLE|nr:hypothetical protein HOLleu_43227 [Holothuria leucospilota]